MIYSSLSQIGANANKISENRLKLRRKLGILLWKKGAIGLKKNSALAGFLSRFQALLDALDTFEMDETLEELNAEFEDALFLLESIEDQDEDAGEEIEDALEELDDLLTRYRLLALERTELRQKALEFEMLLQMAKNTL